MLTRSCKDTEARRLVRPCSSHTRLRLGSHVPGSAASTTDRSSRSDRRCAWPVTPAACASRLFVDPTVSPRPLLSATRQRTAYVVFAVLFLFLPGSFTLMLDTALTSRAADP